MGISIISPPSKEWVDLTGWLSLSGLSTKTVTLTMTGIKRLRLLYRFQRNVPTTDAEDNLILSFNGTDFNTLYRSYLANFTTSTAVQSDESLTANSFLVGMSPRDPFGAEYWSWGELILRVPDTEMPQYFLRGMLLCSTAIGVVRNGIVQGFLSTTTALTSLKFDNSNGAVGDAQSYLRVYTSRNY